MTQPGQIHFTVEQVTKLLAMQDQLNTYIHPEWKSQGFDWNFAIIDECREIKEHLGWKWWKENYKCGLTESNRKQVQLEVIDILHFVLSSAAKRDVNPEGLTDWLNNEYNCYFGNLQETLRSLIEEVVTEGCDVPEHWHCLAKLSGLTTEQVIETYTQKYVLNKFRQDHGYKDGSYVKNWILKYSNNVDPVAREDNEVLEMIIKYFDSIGCHHYKADVAAISHHLALRYKSRLNK